MTDLSDLVEPLKRELAVPGEFATTFPNTTDQNLADSLADGFAEARLQGFFPTMTVDIDAGTVTPDLSTAGGALVLLFTGMRILRSQLRNILVSEKYSAKPGLEFEIQRSAQLLKAELDYMNSRLSDLIAKGPNGGVSASVFDSYEVRNYFQLVGPRAWGGFFDYELK